jgi:hypothetical protein
MPAHRDGIYPISFSFWGFEFLFCDCVKLNSNSRNRMLGQPGSGPLGIYLSEQLLSIAKGAPFTVRPLLFDFCRDDGSLSS